MCTLCDGSMVTVTSKRGWDLQLIPCPLCALPSLPIDHPDYHPGQSNVIGWGGNGIAASQDGAGGEKNKDVTIHKRVTANALKRKYEGHLL